MRCMERRLEIVPAGSGEEEKCEIVKVQERAKVLEPTEQLALPELHLEERITIADQLRELSGLDAVRLQSHALERRGRETYAEPAAVFSACASLAARIESGQQDTQAVLSTGTQ